MSETDAYLVISGLDVPAVAVGPFPEGYDALREFALPPGYDTAESFATEQEADDAVAWHRVWNRANAPS